VAEVSIPAPAAPATLVVTARCRGPDTAAPLELAFGPVAAEVPVTATADPEGVDVVVGPVRRADGALVPDGAVVAVLVSTATGTATGSGQLVDGTVELELPRPGPGPVAGTADVLGARGARTLP
jgi:hypothetical protein